MIIRAPSFNHVLKDPTPNAITISAHHRIVFIEGLYTLLSIDPWCEAAALLDERWLLTVDVDSAKARLAKRHVMSGIVGNKDEAMWRAENNDIPSTFFGRFAILFNQSLTYRWMFCSRQYYSSYKGHREYC